MTSRLAPPPTVPIAGRRSGVGRRQAAALLGAALLVTGTAVWARHVPTRLGDAAPLIGTIRLRLSLYALPAAVLAGTGIWAMPTLARRLRWRSLLGASWVLASAWALALAGTSGPNGITHRLTTPDEYLPELAHVHGLGGYLATFTQHVHDPAPGQFLWSTHVSGGPPGMLLIFAVLARIDLDGPAWAALLVVLVGTAAVPAAAITARCVAGQAAARRAVPFLTFPVLAIWVATSADAFFLGVGTWGVALLAVAARTASRRRADAAALGGGLLLGLALYCSYGIAPLGLLALAVVISPRRPRPLLLGAVGVALVAAGFAGFGFWWSTGLTATRVRYAEGIATIRPYGYFLLANLAALAVALGPAAIAGLAALRGRSRLWWPVGAALLAVAGADLSGLSKGEVERIWLPFAIWLLLATAELGDESTRRRWLAAQIGTALLLQVHLTTYW
jgi:hypothetical protein